MYRCMDFGGGVVALEKGRTAVLLMDFQAGILGMLGAGAERVVQSAVALAEAAREGGVPVIYVVIGFRPGHPELAPHSPIRARLGPGRDFVTTTPGADIHPALAPEPADVVVVKHRVGAFAGTDLEMILRARGIDTLVLAGVSSSGIVLSTVRHGSDHDYKLFIAADACADGDAEVHRVLMEKVYPRQATVSTVGELSTALR
jgi:nicotinamidase-related amidase